MAEYFRLEPWEPGPAESFYGSSGAVALGAQLAPRVVPAPMPDTEYARYVPEADQIAELPYLAIAAAVKPQLSELLARASAPYTGKTTACVLVTSRGTYGGHAQEPAIGEFVTAPSMALARFRKTAQPDEVLEAIVVTGRALRKPKYTMPTLKDYDELSLHFGPDWGPPIIIVSEDPQEKSRVIWPSVHGPAYSVKEPINLADYLRNDEDATLLSHYIQSVTNLKGIDAEYMARLVWYGLRHDTQIYLVGSASRRGEISNAIKPDGHYADIDLLVVAPNQEPAEVQARMITIAEEYYGKLRLETMFAHDWSTGRRVPGIFLYGNNGEKIQLHIGNSMAAINIRPENLERGFYARVA